MLVYQWSLCPGKPLGSPRCAPPVGHARLISPLGSQPSIAVLLTPDLAPGEVSWKMGQGRGGEGDDNEDAGGRTQVSFTCWQQLTSCCGCGLGLRGRWTPEVELRRPSGH